MDFDAVMKRLERLGTAQNRKVYARHGAGKNQYGVSFKELRALGKKLAGDTTLARALWRSGNYDARILATMVADPETIPAKTLDSWVKDVRAYTIAGELAQLVAKTPHAREKVEEWTRDEREFVSTTGWDVLSIIASDSELKDSYLKPYLTRVKRDIHAAPNRTRYSMNNALIAVGSKDPVLQDIALDVAERIGTVEVDHGETGCKTPDATAYIKKIAARKAARG